MRVGVETAKAFSAGAPELLFERAFYVDPRVAARGRTYDVSLDGRRFLMIKDVDSPEPSLATQYFTIMMNWTEQLKRSAASRSAQ